MLATTSGRASPVSIVASTIPQIAPAARAKSRREIRFSPETSTMLGNITISDVPTYGAVLPLASVLTMSLGNPSGSARMPAVPIAVPPPPPSEITPSIVPASASFARNAGTAAAIAATQAPRSVRSAMVEKSSTSSRLMSGLAVGGSSVPTSMRNGVWPRPAIRRATNSSSCPLLS